MADMKSYMREKEKRERTQAGYKEKIAKHKLAAMYRIVLVIAALAALAALVVAQYKRHVYTDYDIIASVERESARGATDIRLGDAILTYSKDGAHCTDTKGNVLWNQTYEIQDVILSVSGNTVAIGDYNGRNIYLASSEKFLGEVAATMPIQNLTVSQAGYVTAILSDTDFAWINTYNSSGELTRYGQARMEDSGYPMAVGMSPNGELLCVAYVYVDAGLLRTKMAFYNFGAVGSNVNDFLVGVYNYTDMLVPYVRFMNENTAFAVGDSRVMIYTGSRKPAAAAEDILNDEIQSVFYSDRYIGLVFMEDNGENRYRLVVYDARTIGGSGELERKTFYFDIDYTDIFFGSDNFVIYNGSQCQIMTMDGIEKYNGVFSKTVHLMLPTENAYRYVLVTDDSIDTIQLK